MDLFEQLDATSADFRNRLYAFMRTCCRDLSDRLPPDAEQWLQTADDYRERRITAGGLKEARVAAWNYLGGRWCDYTSPEVNAVRAVIFLLFPDLGNDEPYEDLWYFVDFCAGAGLSREDAGRRLREAFGHPDGDGS